MADVSPRVSGFASYPDRVDTVVIGAGPAGTTAAYQLAKSGVPVALFEASPHIGGMARTLSLWGQRVDLGPHRFFSSDARVNGLWLEVVGGDYAMVDRLTRIRYRDRFFRYPLQPLDALAKLGPMETARCFASYVRQRLSTPAPSTDHTFESWVVGRFGRRLFEIFFETYTEKLWGIACTDLDADFAAQRIKKLSMLEVLRSLLPRPGRRPVHRTLVDRFAYPLQGTGSVYERMAERTRQLGGCIATSTPVRRVLLDAHRHVRGVELHDGAVVSCHHVISSMPVTALVRGLDDVPADVLKAAAQLRFRNTLLVFLLVDATDLFPDQWLYIHSPELAVGRITNFRNWVPTLYGESRASILALEYWANDDDPIWSESRDASIARATAELRAAGIARDAAVLDGQVVRVPKSYPVYRRGYREHLRSVEQFLRTCDGLMPIGRYGAFKYNNQDHSILMGILAAELARGAATGDLWEVNTDYEVYQEATVITETGLQSA